MSPSPGTAVRPRLRGVFHQVAAPLALIAALLIVPRASTPTAALAVGIFAASLVLLFTVSAIYHRVTWTPRARARMRRADHAAIFVLIAGSITPFALFTLPAPAAERVLWIAWLGAAVGMARALFWVTAPRWLGPSLGVALGWLVTLQFGAAGDVLSRAQIACLLAGGAAYTIGGVAYALRRPNPWPGVLGYHEVFHALTVLAAALHLGVAAQLSVA